MNMIAATGAGLMVSVMLGHAQTPASQPPTPADTQKAAPPAQSQPKPVLQDVTKVGCLKPWQPGPSDATRTPDASRIGTYVLTPITADPTRATLEPTYVLVGGSTVNFAAHLNHKVEISGVEAPAQMPPTAQEIAAAPAARPENKPDTRSMPSLTVQGLKMISPACP